MMRQTSSILASSLAVLLLASLGCGGIGLPGTGSPAPPPPAAENVITGEVAYVDGAARKIEIDDRGRRHVVAFDRSTRVLYEGREYRPEDLERGDVVRLRVDEGRSGGLYAERIDVVESVQARRDGQYDDRHPGDDVHADLSGEVDRVDTSRQEIRLQTSHGSHVVAYDSRTPVYYRGETYRPENLEPGDLVRVETTARRGETPLAEQIEVTRSVQERGELGDAGDRYGADQLTGTVEWVDRRRGEFGLRTDGRDLVTVEIPFDARDATRDRFASLDRGDYVRVEVDDLERGRAELVRFL